MAQAAVKALNRFARTFPIGRPAASLFQGWRLALNDRRGRARRVWKKGYQQAQEMDLPYERGRLCYEMGRASSPTGDNHEALQNAQACFESLSNVHGIQATVQVAQLLPEQGAPFFTNAARD